MTASPDRTSPVAAALRGATGRCPACGRGRLFDGYIALRPSCESCGLNYGFADSGDGPAVFVMLFAGFLAMGFVLWFEFAYEPPLWVHLVVSLPLVLLVCLALLRVLKGVLIALQHRHGAAEARLEP
jgi:uncharacterized protein (DUF983 family)